MDLKNNLIFVKGSVPGSKNSLVLIHKNSKKINKKTTLEKIKSTQTQVSESASKKREKPKTSSEKTAPAPKTEKKEEKK